jgi:hypothetical protein
MSINGIRSPYGTLPSQPATTQRPDQTRGARPAPAARPNAPVQAPATPAGPAAASLQPPPGTDPELWSVLTQDERAFFARLGAMGPLTYGRVLAGQMPPTPSPVSRGGRLDVKA